MRDAIGADALAFAGPRGTLPSSRAPHFVRNGQDVTARDAKAQARRSRRADERRGRLAELAAALLLIVKGYRILARRHKSATGEIDLIAVRGRRLAFVEVKLRSTREEALSSIGPRQTARVRSAAQRWVWRHPSFREHEIGLDAVLIGRSFVPRHVANALQAW